MSGTVAPTAFAEWSAALEARVNAGAFLPSATSAGHRARRLGSALDAEPLETERADRVAPQQSVGLRFVEARDGHNWENWRDRSREGLSWLFPGPLMMVYE